jgi:hypothetical protein
LCTSAPGSLLTNFRGETVYATSAASKVIPSKWPPRDVSSSLFLSTLLWDVTNLNRVKRAIRLLRALLAVLYPIHVYAYTMYYKCTCPCSGEWT